MVKRRELIKLGMAAGAYPLLPLQSLARSPMAPAPLLPQPFRILFDTRFAGSRDQAWQLAGILQNHHAGGLLQAIDGDITRFWNNDLNPAWQAGAPAIAGVTGESVLFCLEQLARDRQMRVLWRQDLPAGSADEGLVSWLIATPQRS